MAVELAVTEEQDGFVSSNALSLAQAHYEPWWVPLGVYASDEMVGFVMHGRWPDHPVHVEHGNPTPDNDHILRVMIDKQHQSKGYGRAAMIALIERIKAQGNCRAIELSFEPTNAVAEKLYASLGFVRTGRMIDGEAEMKLKMSQS
jgi:diamine N-acetyltransferase